MNYAGASYVVFGRAGGFAADLNLSALNGKNVFKISGVVYGGLGYSVSAAGDVNGDGFDDVIVEDVFTTNMAMFLEVASYRNAIYTKHFPTGTWLEVKGLALPEFMIEIEMEAHKSR